jgi:hypothetical protein
VKRGLAALAVVVVVAVVATAGLIWHETRDPAPKYPQISAFSHGHLVRVGPYRYCQVLNPTDCAITGEQGELPAQERHPVQLSVPPEISKAPWVLLRAYEDGETTEEFRPHTRLAVTIPTVDPHRGKLTGLAVMLPTLIRDEAGNEIPFPHAEWTVRLVWS